MTALSKKRDLLRLKRLEKGYTQEAFAKVVGVSKDHIKSLEYGRVNPSFTLMMKICDALESKPDEVFI